jgi:hypothetical protein
MSIIVAQPTNFTTKKPQPIPGETRKDYHRRCQAFRQAHRQPIKAKRRKLQRRSPTTEAMRWLKDKTFAHIYGEKVGDEVYPSMTKETFIGFYNQQGHGKRLPNYKLQDHFDRLKTYYYFSGPNKTAEYALVMIDIDVLKRKMLGSPEGAKSLPHSCAPGSPASTSKPPPAARVSTPTCSFASSVTAPRRSRWR